MNSYISVKCIRLLLFFLGQLLLLNVLWSRPSKSDSLISVLNTLPENKERLNLLIKIADHLNWQDLAEAKKYGFEALYLGKKLNDPIGVGYAMVEISHNYDSYLNKDSAVYYSHAAIDLFQKNRHPAGEAQGYLRLGYIAENEGNFEVATKHLFEALRLFEIAKDDFGLSKAFLGLAKLFYKMDRFEEGITYARKAKPDVELQTDELMAYYHLVLGNNYRGARKYEDALRHYQICQKIALENTFNIDLIYTNTFMADIFQEQGQMDKARTYYQRAIEITRVYKDKNLETFPFIGSGRLYNKEGQYRKAIEQFEAAMQTPTDRVHNYYFHEIYRELSIAHAGLGEHETALAHMVRYSTLRDSFFTERSDRLRSEMQAKYETEKKEEAIQQKKRELAFTIGILIVLASVALLLWRGYVTKRRTNQVLEQRNEEKEFLIKEIHHRVKNNLQVLSSLLSLQSDYVEDPAALDAVTEGRNRVQSMGLIHQKLYTGENLAAVDMEDYIQELTDHLLASFGVSHRIQVSTSVQVPALDVDSAIPLGLIINELVTNALKHAFPADRQHGVVFIRLWIDEKQQLCLEVADDGEGVMQANGDVSSTSFGTDLIRLLSKKLKGTMEQRTSGGFKTLIRFARYRVKYGVN